jgi:hypothetical protein
MTNKKAPAPTGAHGSIAAPSLSKASEATQFLELLGKDPATTRLRAFPHKESTNKAKIAARKGKWDLEQAATWNREGRGVFVVTGNGGDKKEDITSCPALFVEWDDQPIEWQLTAWIELGLPEPTMQVPTGGRSVHNWWVMTEPISPAEFEALQIRLYTHCKSDELKDPSRVMRLPGFAYIGPDDKPAGLVELVNVTGNRYSAAEIEACLPAAAAPAKPASKPKTKRSAVDLPPRSEADLLEALATRVPAFLPDESRRDELLNLAFRLWVEVGAARAEQILAKHSPAVTDLPSYFKGKAPTRISAGSIWPFLNEYYDVDLERHDLKRSAPAPAAKQQDKPAKSASLQSLIQQLQDGWDPKTLKPQGLSAGRIADMLPAADLRFNEMTLRAEVHTSSGWLRITDADMDSAYVVLSGKGWKVGSEPVIKAIIHTARQAPHHPVRAYLQQVEADPGIAPFDLDQVAPQFFRANQPLHVAMVRKWLIGAVSRALNPGCQMDYVLVLQGAQGQLKSTSLGALASPDWYCSSIPENEKDLLLNIHSTWIYELAELESVTSRKEAGRLKNLITTSADLVRVPYGRTSERMARQSVFCATVNEDTFLRDDTGNRRFWVVPVEGSKPIDKARAGGRQRRNLEGCGRCLPGRRAADAPGKTGGTQLSAEPRVQSAGPVGGDGSGLDGRRTIASLGPRPRPQHRDLRRRTAVHHRRDSLQRSACRWQALPHWHWHHCLLQTCIRPAAAAEPKAESTEAADLGVMGVNLRDAVKFNYGFQGALQGAGTPNQAGHWCLYSTPRRQQQRCLCGCAGECQLQ